MTLQVIGAGMGRTGTISLQMALDSLGLKPCFRMTELFKHPEKAADWLAADRGEEVDWQEALAGYTTALDWPVCDHYGKLAEAFPEAKFILTVRDIDAWIDSTQRTIFSPENQQRLATGGVPAEAYEVIKCGWRRHFDGRINDREVLAEGFRRHVDLVKQTIPAERLLVFDVSEGWGPLCQFLGTQLQIWDFPFANTGKRFRKNVLGLKD